MMTSNDKQLKARAIGTEGRILVDKAELLLQTIAIRNTRLSHEMKQVQAELEEKLVQKNK